MVAVALALGEGIVDVVCAVVPLADVDTEPDAELVADCVADAGGLPVEVADSEADADALADTV